MSLEAHQEKGEGEGDDTDMEQAIKLSLDPAFLPQGQAPVGGVTIRDPVPETTLKLPEVVGKGKAIVTEEQVAHSLIDIDLCHDLHQLLDSERTESETEAAAPKGNKDQGEVDSSRVTLGDLCACKKTRLDQTLEKHMCLLLDQTLSTLRLMNSFYDSLPKVMITEAIKTYMSSLNHYRSLSQMSITTSLPTLVTPPLSIRKLTIYLPHLSLKITPFIALLLRVGRLVQECLNVKKTEHSADVLLQLIPILLSSKHDKNKSETEILPIPSVFLLLIEALIADKDAMDKEVKDRVKNHKRKHDNDNDEDDDDDEGPSAGSNQALTSTGWQITDTRDVVVDSSMPKSNTESKHYESISYDFPNEDERAVSDSGGHLDNVTFPTDKRIDIIAVYGITHDGLGEGILLNKQVEPLIREAVRSQMRIPVADYYGPTQIQDLMMRMKRIQKSSIQMILKIVLLNIQVNLNHLTKTEQDIVFTRQSHVDKKPGNQYRVGDLQLGLKVIKQRSILMSKLGLQSNFYFNEDYDDCPYA
ncbi:hypothetical protein Tco_0577054 [Tanacetum coccineum]